MNKADIIYGMHPLSEALKSGKSIDKVFIQKGLQQDSTRKLMNDLREADIPYQFVPKVKLDKITRKNHQGVIAYTSPIEYSKLEWLIPAIYESGETPLLLILDHITDVRNFGAICRSAECAGAHAVVIPEKGAAQVNEDAVKTSAGALMRLPVCRVKSLVDSVKFLKQSGLEIVGCHERGKHAFQQKDLKGPLAMILGSEELGISPALQSVCDADIHIPMKGETGSLNVSVAGALLLYEAIRQRNEHIELPQKG